MQSIEIMMTFKTTNDQDLLVKIDDLSEKVDELSIKMNEISKKLDEFSFEMDEMSQKVDRLLASLPKPLDDTCVACSKKGKYRCEKCKDRVCDDHSDPCCECNEIYCYSCLSTRFDDKDWCKDCYPILLDHYERS